MVLTIPSSRWVYGPTGACGFQDPFTEHAKVLSGIHYLRAVVVKTWFPRCVNIFYFGFAMFKVIISYVRFAVSQQVPF